MYLFYLKCMLIQVLFFNFLWRTVGWPLPFGGFPLKKDWKPVLLFADILFVLLEYFTIFDNKVVYIFLF